MSYELTGILLDDRQTVTDALNDSSLSFAEKEEIVRQHNWKNIDSMTMDTYLNRICFNVSSDPPSGYYHSNSQENTASSKPSVENSTPTSVYVPQKSSKAWIWVLVILAVVAAAAYFWIRRSPSEGSQEKPTTQQTTAAEVSVAYIIDTELLNLRTGPDKSYDVVTTMPKGAEVTVQKTEGNWACVSYQGQEGWCSMKYLSFDEQEAPATEQTTAPDYPMAYVKVSSVLNLRTGPGKSYDLITTMPDGAKVYVQKTEGNWAYVSYQDQEGWCSLKYLSYAD